MDTDNIKIIRGIGIDPRIFTFGFSCKCSGECCYYGVYTDLKEHDRIIELKDKIVSLMDDTQTIDVKKWFEPEEEDEDFESGVAVGTELYNNKCVFLDKSGLCTLQKLAINEGEHEWKYKPLYCILYPLTIYEGALTIDEEHMERLKTCNKLHVNGTSIYEACAAELKHLFGEEGFAELEEYRKEYLGSQNAREVA